MVTPSVLGSYCSHFIFQHMKTFIYQGLAVYLKPLLITSRFLIYAEWGSDEILVDAILQRKGPDN